jgi:sarcosine oxidase subunit gamma
MDKQWLRELPPAVRFIFQGDAAARSAAAAIWNVPFSETACRALCNEERATLWLGPEEYLLWEPLQPGATPILAEMAESLRGHACSLVDISHRQFAWEVSGPWAETILAGGCPLDLDPAQFPIGMCTRTLLAKAEIVLWRRQRVVFHLEAGRSFAPYVVGLLSEIAAGYDFGDV